MTIDTNDMNIKYIMSQRNVYNYTNLVDSIDKWYSWAEQNKVYYIFSFDNMGTSVWSNPPIWLVEGKYAQPWNKYTYWRAEIDFYNTSNPLQEENRQAYINLWKFLANRYKNNKYAIFNIAMNEPFYGNQLVNFSNGAKINENYARFVERLIDELRNTGDNHLYFVDQPVSYFYAPLVPVNRNNIVWEVHAYVGETAESFDEWKGSMDRFVKTYVTEFGKPMFMGEYGFIDWSSGGMIDNSFPEWKNILTGEVSYLKASPIAGFDWHEYPWLDGEWYDYYHTKYEGGPGFTSSESDFILQTVLGGPSTTTTPTCSGTSIGQDGCSSGVCCCFNAAKAYKNTTKITIDGNLNEWSNALSYQVTHASKGTSNNKALFKTLWDNNNLYVAFEVNDSSLYNDSTELYLDDSVEMYVDGLNDKKVDYGSDDKQYMIDIGNRLRDYGVGVTTPTFPHAVARTSTGYRVETAIPFSQLGITASDNKVIGWDIGINDDDNGGDVDSQLIWYAQTSPYNDTSKFGNLLLTSGAVPQCSDGTSYGSCSATKPKYCSSGTLINKCSVCGCSSGYTCNSTTGSCYLTLPSTCDSTCKNQGYTSGSCKAGVISGNNLADIPDDWSGWGGIGYYPNNILDYNVVRTAGKPSIRLEPTEVGDNPYNTAREVDGNWYPINIGDHIVAKCWMKIDPLPSGYVYEDYAGARIGVDLYNKEGGHNYLLGPWTPSPDEIANYVHWGSQGWNLRTLDFIVPSTLFTKNYMTNPPVDIPPSKATHFVLWLQVWSSKYGASEPGNAWFSDCELYINPTSVGTCQSGETSIGQDGCSSGQTCCCGSSLTSTTTTIPSSFTGTNFVCNYVQTNNLWECSLDYTNNLDENGKVKFHFIDSATSEVKSTGSIWTNTGSSGTVGSEISCNSYHGTYNVVWRAYRSSDTSYSNPVTFSTSFKTITCS